MEKDEIVQNEFSGEIYIIETNDKLPDNRKYPFALIQAAQNQKQTNTRGSENLIKLKTINIDIEYHLINGQTGIIRHIESAQGSAHKM